MKDLTESEKSGIVLMFEANMTDWHLKNKYNLS